MTTLRTPAVAALALACCATLAHGQSFTIVAQEGQPAGTSGVGSVSSVGNVFVNNAGTTFVEVDTDNADTDADSVLLRNGVLLQREGQSLPAPSGAALGSFGAISADSAGNYAQNLSLDGTAGSNDDSGLYYNGNLVVQEGAPTGLPGIADGTFRGFFGAKLADTATPQIAFNATAEPAGTTGVSSVIGVYTLGAGGAITNARTVALEGESLPGLNGNVQLLETSANEYAFNSAGNVLFAGDTDAATSEDGFIYLSGTGVLAQEGAASPVAGRNYGSLTSPEVDLNDAGDTVFVANLAGGTTSTNDAIILNGSVFVQEGDAVFGLSDLVFDNLASAQVALDDEGNLLFVGEFNADSATDRGLFLNDTLLLREGDTIDGQVVSTINTFADTLSFSENGDFALLDVTFEGGIETALLVAIPEPATLGLLAAAPLALLRRRRA